MLEFIFDLIFPKRCVGCKKMGSYICENCFVTIRQFDSSACPVCQRRSITGETHPSCISSYSLDGLLAGVEYRGVVKKIVYRFKYKPYLTDLEKTMQKLFSEMLMQHALFNRLLHSHPIVAVVPLFPKKLRTRGYNQAEILGRGLSREFKLPFYPKILRRIKPTNPQFKLNKDERIKNMLGAFDLDPVYKKDIRSKTILLVDDVSTSCVTLKECAKVLKRNGARHVYGVTFAREI